MRGYSVPRKAGWDTHGLPVEVEVEKELRIHGKAAIEEYGVEPFIKKCIESVFRYTSEWEELTERVALLGRPRRRVRHLPPLVRRERVVGALASCIKKGLLYQGHKVVWWWAQGGTALSSGEVGQGYKTVDDPSVVRRVPARRDEEQDARAARVDDDAVDAAVEHVRGGAARRSTTSSSTAKDGRRFVVAKALVEALAKKLGGARRSSAS